MTVTEATVTLPFLTFQRSQFLDGGSTPRLEQHLDSETVALSDAVRVANATEYGLSMSVFTADERPQVRRLLERLTQQH